VKVSILTPDISHNCLYRSYCLARLLQPKHKVEIIGPRYGSGLWPPLKDMRDVTVKSVAGDRKTGKLNWRLLLKMIDGDVVYACKPYGVSFGIGLLAKLTKHIPLILDIDDYEPGFYQYLWQMRSWISKLMSYFKTLNNINSYQWMLILQKLIPLADEITVTNKQLQKLYGGTVIPHAIDTDVLKPTPHINRYPVIGYIGTVRPHKGLYELARTLVLLRHKNYECIITASGDGDYLQYASDLINKARLDNRIRIIDQQPRSSLNSLLATIDIVVIPQQKQAVSDYQTPAKLLDAMATGKVIVASDIPTIREVLGDLCDDSILVTQGDLLALTLGVESAINHVASGSEWYKYITGKTREWCVKKYGIDVVRKKMGKVIRSIK
jgi:glycosyltransferase involved in cell wall biosynthesis